MRKVKAKITVQYEPLIKVKSQYIQQLIRDKIHINLLNIHIYFLFYNI